MSVKAEKNVTIPNNFDSMTNKQLFMSPYNIKYITDFTAKNNFKPLIPIQKIMDKWADDNNINDYEYVTDVLQTLGFINKSFVSAFIPEDTFKTEAVVTDEFGNNVIKKYKDMMAADFHTLNLWEKNEIYRHNGNFRNNNKIPIWQKSMQTRHYDRDNGGLACADPDRASLDNQIHGYLLNPPL